MELVGFGLECKSLPLTDLDLCGDVGEFLASLGSGEFLRGKRASIQ